MAQEPRSTRTISGRAAANLVASRWIVGAGLFATGAVALSAGTPPLLWLGASAVVLAAGAVAAPQRRKRDDGDEPGSAPSRGFEALSLQNLADAVPDPMIVFDREGAIAYANEQARHAFGRLGAGTLLALRFRTPEIQELNARLQAGSPGPLAVEYAERVPIERWFKVAGMPVGRDAGLFALVFKDQSEIRRIDRMRADFIANASHELRTPLASVAGFIETLRGPARNDAVAREKFLQIMQAQAARMARLIDDLLSLSRLEMKPYAAPSATLDLVQLVDGVAGALGPLAAETGVTIEKHFPDAPAPVRGHRDELIQVFENLLENACKYGQSGKRVVVTVTPADRAQDLGPRVSVTDFGPGIPEEHIPRVTERFYRVDVGTSRAQKGTGLGLAIVKHILTRHDARLTIQSRVGEGATFTVHFPLT